MGEEDQVRVAEVWEAIEARMPCEQVQAAVATVTGMLPPPEAVPEGDWRAEPVKKASTVVGLCRMLTATITFGANARGAPVLAAMIALGEQLGTEARWSVKNPRTHPQVVTGPWKHLVFGQPACTDGSVDRGAYIFCRGSLHVLRGWVADSCTRIPPRRAPELTGCDGQAEYAPHCANTARTPGTPPLRGVPTGCARRRNASEALILPSSLLDAHMGRLDNS
ncbi:hypothetical protein [Nonomuraea fuscirosea]|uniref:hypothetical protein n=1 Tax=Nonomuraea fuscirosea TaxID=1291556 RepID=UPI003409C208